MAKLIPVTGTVTELSNSEIKKNWTDYGSVHIRGDDGTVTRIQNALVYSDMPNALNIGAHGTFYFRRIRIWGGSRRFLVASVADGKLRTTSVANGAAVYGVMTLMTVPLMPFVVGLFAFPFCLAATISHARAQRQITALRRNPPSGTEVLHVRTI